MGRAPCCDKANVKKGPWSPEEDDKLKDYIECHGTGGNWIALPQKIGLKRCGKSCRLRWLNYLRQGIKHGGFSEEEENIICSLYISIGSRWSIIAAQLPGRTDNDIKNYWNTRLKKKLLGKQRKQQAAARNNRVVCLKQQEIMKKVISNSADQGNNHHHHHHFMTSTAIDIENRYPTTFTNSYSPMAPTPISASQYPYNQEHPSLMNTNHDPLKNLLIKLGGRFSYDHDHADENHNINHCCPAVLDVPSTTQPQFYDNSINFSVPSTSSTTPASIMTSSLNNISSSSSYSQLLQSSNIYDIDGAAANLNMLQGVLNDGFPLDVDDMVYNNNPHRFEGLECFHGVDMAGNGSSTGTSSSSAESTCSWFDMGYPSLITNNFEGCEQGLLKECNNFENSSYQRLA